MSISERVGGGAEPMDIEAITQSVSGALLEYCRVDPAGGPGVGRLHLGIITGLTSGNIPSGLPTYHNMNGNLSELMHFLGVICVPCCQKNCF